MRNLAINELDLCESLFLYELCAENLPRISSAQRNKGTKIHEDVTYVENFAISI